MPNFSPKFLPFNMDDNDAGDKLPEEEETPTGQDEEDTSSAENNEDSDDTDSHKDESGQEESEVLKQRLSAQNRSNQRLGTISQKAVEVLLGQALKGDKDARKALENAEVKRYAERKFPDKYNQVFSSEASLVEDLAEQTERKLEERQREKDLRSSIARRGVKGEKDFNKILETAKALKNFSVENAVNAAITAVKGVPSAPPNMGGGMYIPSGPSGNDSGMTSAGRQMAREFGIPDEDIQKYHKPGSIKTVPFGSSSLRGDEDLDSFNSIRV